MSYDISSVAMQIAAGCARRSEQDKAELIKHLVDTAWLNDWVQEGNDPDLNWPDLPPVTWAFTSQWQAVKFFTVVIRHEMSLPDPWASDHGSTWMRTD